MPVRLPCLLLCMLLLAVIGAAPASADPVNCNRYVGPFGSDGGPGSLTQPFRTPQRLINSLTAGQTGCLLEGTYSQEVDGPYVMQFRHGGAPGAPITVRSAPGQRATIHGITIVPEFSDYVTLSDLDFDMRRAQPDNTVGLQIQARGTIIERNDITNHAMAICSVLGVVGWGEAIGTIIRDNTFHDCGGTENQLEHSLYIEYTQNVLVTDNLFLRSGTYAIHFYPTAQNSTVTHNVMVDNGGGVIFAGEGDSASRNDTVSHNVIVGSYRRPGIHSWWGGAMGTGNVAKSNCLSNPTTNVDVSAGGFTSTNNVIASPSFRNPAQGDYRLAANSPCLALVGYDTAAKLLGAPADPPAPPAPPTPSATTVPVSTPEATPPPQEDGSAPVLNPNVEPVEAARLAIDDAAFSASGGGRARR